MKPPQTIDVIDKHGGFTAITTKRHDTLWRPGQILLGKTTKGELVRYNEKSFYQLNDNVTMATYKVKGYRYPIAIWFDNKTKRRIA